MWNVVFALSEDTIVGIVVVAILVPLASLLALGGYLIVRDTIRQKGRWGINTRIPECKKCGEPLSAVRVPKSWRGALWGGWTCPECGLELDKWGEPYPHQPRPARWKVDEAKENEDRRRGTRKKETRRRRRDERYQRKDED